MATRPVEDVSETSIFQGSLPIAEKLDRARMELLDLSARNRLLNMPRSSKGSKAIEIVDEKTAETFRLLVKEGRVFTFLPGKAIETEAEAEAEEEVADLDQPEGDGVDESGRHLRHVDTKLQTRLTSKGLQKRLLEMFYDARTLEEEQGVNILYLALGALKWIDPQIAANVRYAPLLLIPVSLDRGNAGEKFKLRIRQEDYASNLSLEAFLDRVHGIRLPEFEASEDFDPVKYMDDVAEAVSSKLGWMVLHDDITLGFFSFAKFLMYRDLDPDNWPIGSRISERPLIRGLLSDGFDVPDDMIPEDAWIDTHILPADMLHIVDSDSSQALAIHEVRRGRDMVIQGPPGTGKSQTIANIVASAVADGRTVLFVAEKMAALEVVKRRLDATGVGDTCLELHSNKANKRALLEELRRTWELGPPRGQDSGTLNRRLTEARDNLNAHAERMHQPHPRAGLTSYQVIGQLARLRLSGERPNDIRIGGATTWSRDDLARRHDVISELAERIEAIGKPAEHPWHGVGVTVMLPADVDRLVRRIVDIATRLTKIESDGTTLARKLDAEPVTTLAGIDTLRKLAHRIAAAPDLAGDAIGSEAWANRISDVERLVEFGERHAHLLARLKPRMQDVAWTAEVTEARDHLAGLPDDLGPIGLAACTEIAKHLPDLLRAAWELSSLLGRDVPSTTAGVRRLTDIAERVSAAPEATAEVFAADLWDTGVERAADLAKAAARLEEAKAAIGDALLGHAWEMDLRASRAALAAHGIGFFRIFSGEWRRANRLVRTILSRPDQTLDETLQHLDALARGQSARNELREGADFGQSAFGEHWRSDKSVSAPLEALVEWMKSLKGLGAEPRLIAARRPDRARISIALGRVRALLDTIEPLVHSWFDALGDMRASAFNDAPSPNTAELAPLLVSTKRTAAADAVTSALFQETPADLRTRVSFLGDLIEWQRIAQKIEESNELGCSAFANAWNSDKSNWLSLRGAFTWIAANGDIRMLASKLDDRKSPAVDAEGIIERRSALALELGQLSKDLQLDVGAAVGAARLEDLPIKTLFERLNVWSRSGEQLSRWVAYRNRAREASGLGCEDVVAHLRDGRLGPADAIPAFEMAYYEALYADLVHLDPELGRFDGTLHGRLAKDFAEMDRQRIALASVEVVRAHHRRVPAREGGGRVGPLGVLRSEMQKKRAHMPVRKLMEKAGAAVLALKPVFMMSPLSIAQFLPPGIFEFDLLVMDEASQIQPVDALGAVARAKQVVVVGDPKQLPPTAFFTKMTGTANDDEEEDATRVGDIESILGLFTARGLPTRMLRWHYRSKHQSLIAVSNRQFYDGKLFIVPSPYTTEAGMGLRFHHIPNGIFDAGGTRTNMVEAKIVAEAIARHAHEYPGLSLGVAAFSAAQRRAILDQLEIIRRTLPLEIEAFFQAHLSEPFFVKNLENVQGDERDVIFISVGYGPTVLGGRPPMRFGPLGTEGGERRLNVLISRAKRRCEVFSSITDEDIDPDFAATRKGVFAFRMFLHYARTGRLTLSESTGRDHESVFEEQVATALQARGYQVHRQVGLAGFFIDLAIADEERPGRYLLGIECDGASYHACRSARDRDRLRQSVLETHGWTIHRIWSTDWFHRPDEQLQLVVNRIETAKAEHDSGGERFGRATPVQVVAVDRDNVTEIALVRSDEVTKGTITVGYVQASLKRPPHRTEELHDTPTGLLSELAERVVAVEGPVHIEEVIDRIKDAWLVKRAGGRILLAVKKAVAVSVRMGRIVEDGSFLSMPDAKVQVRDRSEAASPTLRRADMLPPAEIRVAAVDVVRMNFGASPDQVVTAVSRALGIKSTSAQVRSAILSVVDDAIGKGELVKQGGVLAIPS
jgi:very-short-patch-repair endonuclease